MIKLGLKVPQYWTLLALGTLVLPISPYFCLAIYILVGLISALSYDYTSLKKEQVILGLCLLVVSIWMILRTGSKWGWGVHSITYPTLYPVTLIKYVPFFIFFYFLTLRPFPLSQIERLSWSFIITAFPQFIISFGEKYLRFLPGTFFYPGEDLAILKVSFFTDYAPQISAGFFTPNVLGCYCVIVFPIALSLLLKENNNLISLRKLRQRLPRALIFEILLKLSLIIIFSALILIVLVWSQSRNSFMCFFLEIIAFILYTRAKWLIFLGLASLMLVSISIFSLGWLTTIARLVVPEEIWDRLISTEIIDDRFTIYQCAFDLIREKPLMGWGIGNFAPECENRLGFTVNHAHNIFLQLASEIGLPFTIATSCIMAYIIFKSINRMTQKSDFEKGINDLIFGFTVSSCSVIILSCLSIALLHSYRLVFLFWISLSIAYVGSSNEMFSKTNLETKSKVSQADS